MDLPINFQYKKEVFTQFIRAMQNMDQSFGTHYGDELAKLLQPENESQLTMLAAMFIVNAAPYWDITERRELPPQHVNQMLFQSWVNGDLL